jgi:hypothetical protein
MSVGEQPQYRGVVIGDDWPEPVVAQPGDRGRQGIVRVVLRCLRRADQPHSRRECGRHVDDVLAGGDELLSQQAAQATRRLNRPRPLVIERFSPRQQPLHLPAIRRHTQPSDRSLIAVDRDCSVRRLVGVHPDQHHRECLLVHALGRHDGHS